RLARGLPRTSALPQRGQSMASILGQRNQQIKNPFSNSSDAYPGANMATRMCWLGHSCLLFESGGQNSLIDPFLTGNPKAAMKAADVPADFVLISHGHGDHVGDAVTIAKRTGGTVICNYEISLWLEKQGLEKVHGMQHGGGHGFAFGRVK